MSQLVLTTARYWNKALIVRSGLAPVGASVGVPKYPLGYAIAATVGMLAPYGLLDVDDQAKFERLYRKRLDRFGVDKIRRALVAIAKAGTVDTDPPGQPYRGVVLLCYEDLTKPGEWCHRRMFAAWWEEQTGEQVPELTLELLEAAGNGR